MKINTELVERIFAGRPVPPNYNSWSHFAQVVYEDLGVDITEGEVVVR